MRVLRGVLFALAVLVGAAPALAIPPTFTGDINGTMYPAATFTIPSSATLVGFGDSITFGYGTTSCSAGTTAHTPTGTCWLDKLGIFYGANVANIGISGSCLESTTTGGSGCNTASSGIANGIDRYTSALVTPFAGNNSNWFFLQYGINDAVVGNNDPQISVATFKANYLTIINALLSAGTPKSQIIIGLITANDPSNANYNSGVQSRLAEMNEAIAQIAIQKGLRLANTWEATAFCLPGCMFDTLHPNDTGDTNVANAYESATYMNAISADQAFAAIAGLIYNNAAFNNLYLNGTISALGGVSANVATGVNANAARGVNANGLNVHTTSTGATNPALLVYNAAGNPYGTLLWHDGTNFVTGNMQPSGSGGWAWLTYTAGTYPTLNSGFTKVAGLDAGGTLSVAAATVTGNISANQVTTTNQITAKYFQTGSATFDYAVTTASKWTLIGASGGAGNLVLYNNGSMTSGSSSYGPTGASINGVVDAIGGINTHNNGIINGGPFSGITTLGVTTSATIPILYQTSANGFAKVSSAMTAGSITVALSGYTSTPVCVASEINSGTGNGVYISAISNTSLTVKSTSGTDTSTVNILCVGNPN